MFIFTLIAIIAGAVLLAFKVAEYFESFGLGMAVAILVAVLAFAGVTSLVDSTKGTGRIDLAAERCIADIKADPDWVAMSNPALRRVATEKVGTVGLTENQQVVARDTCFVTLQMEASAVMPAAMS